MKKGTVEVEAKVERYLKIPLTSTSALTSTWTYLGARIRS